MATEKVVLSGSWQLVVNDGVDFIIQNPTMATMHVCFSNTPPTESSAYHTLKGGDGFIRMGVVGAVYVRCEDDSLYLNEHIIVTRGV